MRRLTVPAMPPSIMSAVEFLYVSTPAMSSGETSPNDRPRELFALKLSRPLNSLRTCGRPRMMTPEGSAEKCVVSPEAAKRVTVMPVTRCSASATDLSGNAPMSVAVIESTTVSASFLISCEVCSALRMPVTRISVRSSSDFVVVALVLAAGARPASWAIANGASSVAPMREWIIQSRATSRSRLHAATFFDALDTAMPPLYRKCLRSDEFENRLLVIFLECSEIAHTSKSRFANSCWPGRMSRRAMICRVMNEIPSPGTAAGGAAAQLQVIVSLASSGDVARAMAEARLITDRDVAIQAWRFLSEVNANTQRWAEAFSAIENALVHAPDSRDLRLRRAQLLEQQGNDRAALAELESLARAAEDSPQLLVHLAAQLRAAGRSDEAEAILMRALQRWPADARCTHNSRARLAARRGNWMRRGISSDAIERQPRELHLRLVAADLLRNAGAADQALELLERGLELAPDSAIFLTSIGVLLEGMDRLDAALPYLRDAQRGAPQSVAVRRNLVPALMRTGAAGEARSILDGLLAQFPDDQQLIA